MFFEDQKEKFEAIIAKGDEGGLNDKFVPGQIKVLIKSISVF